MVCLGLEPGAVEWKAQTNPLSYGGTHIVRRCLGAHISLCEPMSLTNFGVAQLCCDQINNSDWLLKVM